LVTSSSCQVFAEAELHRRRYSAVFVFAAGITVHYLILLTTDHNETIKLQLRVEFRINDAFHLNAGAHEECLDFMFLAQRYVREPQSIPLDHPRVLTAAKVGQAPGRPRPIVRFRPSEVGHDTGCWVCHCCVSFRLVIV
jgi:hypothetical protein